MLTLKEVYDQSKPPCKVKIVHGVNDSGPWGFIKADTTVKILARGRQNRVMLVRHDSPDSFYCSIPTSCPVQCALVDEDDVDATANDDISLQNLVTLFGSKSNCHISVNFPADATLVSTEKKVTPSAVCSGVLAVKAMYKEDLLYIDFKDGRIVATPIHLPIKVKVIKGCQKPSDISLSAKTQMFHSVIKLYPSFEVKGCKFKFNELQPYDYLYLTTDNDIPASPAPPPPDRAAVASPNLLETPPPIPDRAGRSSANLLQQSKRKLPAPPPFSRSPRAIDVDDDDVEGYEEPDDWVDSSLPVREPGDGSDRFSVITSESSTPLSPLSVSELKIGSPVTKHSQSLPTTPTVLDKDARARCREDMAYCLSVLGLTQYEQHFHDNTIDYELLCTLDVDMLVEDIGMKAEHAEKLIAFTQE